MLQTDVDVLLHPRRSVCTLADLDEYLALQHKVSSYNDLCMGPLLVHELVVANFKPPAHVIEIPKVGDQAPLST